MNLERIPALSLFSTEAFRDHWWIKLLCEQVGDVFVTDDGPPNGSFTTYFRVISRRSYGSNELLRDLYYLHELRHLRGFLRRGPITDWLAWQRAMGHSELDASVTSECVVHFLVPEARRAFEGEIWVDRFLRDRKFQWFVGQTDLEEIGVLRSQLSAERIRALSTPTHNDYLEWQIHNYGVQNMRWYVIWAKPVRCGPSAETAAWRVVEEHLARPDWIERHADWLDSVSILPGGIRFPMQATAFAEVYRHSVDEFGNWPLAT